MVFTSVLAWIILSISWVFWFCAYRKRNKPALLVLAILAVWWFITLFNAWYEGFYLFRRIAFASTLNSLALTLLTPLFYFYYRFLIIKKLPTLTHWIRSLSLPLLLTILYGVVSVFHPVANRYVYGWSEYLSYFPEWWTLFRLVCYGVWIGQLLVYRYDWLNRKIKEKRLPVLIEKELLLVRFLGVATVVNLLIPSEFCNLLYNVVLIYWGIHIGKQSVSYWLFKRKLRRLIISFFASSISVGKEKNTEVVEDKGDNEQNNKETIINREVYFRVTPGQMKKMDLLLNSSDYLHDPDLTLKKLAADCGCNMTYLSRYFNNQLGIKFNKFISDCRLNEAEALLTKTDKTVSEIAGLVGFKSLSVFYEVFYKRHQMTPIQWRMNRRTNERMDS